MEIYQIYNINIFFPELDYKEQWNSLWCACLGCTRSSLLLSVCLRVSWPDVCKRILPHRYKQLSAYFVSWCDRELAYPYKPLAETADQR